MNMLTKLRSRNALISYGRKSKYFSSDSSLKPADSKTDYESKPGFFSRNPGVIFAGVVLGLGGYFYRGSQNKKKFADLQTPIGDKAPISPYEAYELRSANDITVDLFKDIVRSLPSVFKERGASYAEFDQFLGFKLHQICPKGIQNGHHLERVLMNLKEEPKLKDQKDPNVFRMDVETLLSAFSLTVKGTAEERLDALFALVRSNPEENAVSKEKLIKLIDCLLLTYQIPSEKRILPIEAEKYPFQEYEETSPERLLNEALLKLQKKIDKEKTEEEKTNLIEKSQFTLEEFQVILKSNMICIWGECFNSSSKKRNRN